ncbi:unnamed protein product [Effrenium voratum]|nr:unnamed protein product [Effrenium voratum]
MAKFLEHHRHERASHASSRTSGTGAVSPPSQCKVHKINFSGLEEVQGTLDERIAETELHLDLGNTNVTDLKIFENTKLTHLCLQNTQVAGDLSAFSQATRLKSLALQNTQVTGDLSGVSQATWLMFLSLENTQVTGDLSGLSQATRLKRLNLENTQVTGDLSGVSQATWLVFLNLGNTQVTGDLSGLSQATSLMFLYLGKTQVTGDLSGLPQKAWLKRLNLRNTTVAGDIFTLRKLPGLNSADLSRTQVSGKLDEVSWLGHSQQLQALNLAETKVALDPTSYDYFSRSCEKGDNDHCFLPKLATLDLSGCPLNSAAAHICQNLRASPSLGRLEAANAGLSGEIRTQDVLQVQAVAVDLSSNKLTHIGALPPNCQSFTAASNYGNLTFGKGVLGKAITARVSLDLWNVTFEDPTESAYLLDQHILEPTEHRAVFNEERGFACYDVLPKSFQISPELFAPERLCSCLPGWNGSGATCQQCPKNTYKDSFEGACQQCPEGSQADPGAKSLTQCRCKMGEVFNESGVPRCGCPTDEAQRGICA